MQVMRPRGARLKAVLDESPQWTGGKQRLAESPALEAKTLFEWLTERYPERYEVGRLRTLQRRVKMWRAGDGVDDLAILDANLRPLHTPRIENPCVRPHLLGQPHRLECRHARHQKPRLDVGGISVANLYTAFLRPPRDLLIERRKSLLEHLSLMPPLHLALSLRTQLFGRQFLRAPPKTVADVAPTQSELVSVEVDAANHHVRVRVVGVVVVHRRPLEPAPEILFNALHVRAHVGGEVKLLRVLRSDDDSELVFFVQARCRRSRLLLLDRLACRERPASRPSRLRRAGCSGGEGARDSPLLACS